MELEFIIEQRPLDWGLYDFTVACLRHAGVAEPGRHLRLYRGVWGESRVGWTGTDYPREAARYLALDHMPGAEPTPPSTVVAPPRVVAPLPGDEL